MKSIWLGLALCAAASGGCRGASASRRRCPRLPARGWKSAPPAKPRGCRTLAIISAGVVTRQTTATAAIQENAARMERVLAALKRAGIEERDVQTSSINLNPEYRYQENRAPQLVGYTASNQVSIRFRDIRNTGKILDALVAEGANQINGPTLTIDKPEAALDEARLKALANGRARADVYARALGQARRSNRVDQRERRKLSGAAAHADDDGGSGSDRGFEDPPGRAKAAGHALDRVRPSVRQEKGRPDRSGRPSNVADRAVLADGTPTNEIHDCQENYRSQQ